MTSPADAQRKAFFPGSFDPFTRGHESIVRRALAMFSHVVVGIGINPDKKGVMSTELRRQLIEAVFAGDSRVSVVSYSGMTVDAVKAAGACCIVRGVRDVADFDYELKIADFNRGIAGIDTLFLPAHPALAGISSTALRQEIARGGNVSGMLPSGCPQHIVDELRSLCADELSNICIEIENRLF